MKHARSDYDARVQDAAGLIPADEPVFLLRAQDRVAPRAVLAWCHAAHQLGVESRVIAEAHLQAERMIEWQRKHRIKLPDLPAEEGGEPKTAS